MLAYSITKENGSAARHGTIQHNVLLCDLNVLFITQTWRLHRSHMLDQRGTTGGPQATCCPRPLESRLAKLFVNFLLVTTSSFIFFYSEGFEKKS
jgi:hypothetical protein